MPKLRKMLSRCFGYASLISAVMFISLAPVLFGSLLPHATPRFHAEPVGLFLIAMRELILLMPPVAAIASGMAWFALRKGAPSVRPWAIAASILLLLLSVPFFNAGVVLIRYHLAGVVELVGVFVFFAIFFLLGIAGLLAFGKRDATLEANLSPANVRADSKSLNELATTM